MKPNPVLKKLGFSSDDRVVIIHTDDIGMCQATIDAFTDLVDYGLISSGAVMVPCPWFLSVASFGHSHPEVDLGVHLTLTSEYDHYRWGPVGNHAEQSGLVDEQGFFHKTSEAVWALADPDAAALELEAQVTRAMAEGMHLTHLDTHMGSVAHPKLIPAYVQLAMRFGLPAMIPRMSADELLARGDVDPDTAQLITRMTYDLEEMGIPLLDGISGLELLDSTDRFEQAKLALSALKPGITHFIIHPARDTPELRAITDSWDCRVADYETFTCDQTREFIENEGIHIIGYQPLKDLMPSLD